MKTKLSLVSLLGIAYGMTITGCNMPGFVATLSMLAPPPADFPALHVKSKPLTSLVTTSGTVTWYGPGYEGDAMNGGGKYRDRGPIVIACPVKRDRRGRAILLGGKRYQPILPYGTMVRLTIPDGRSIVGPITDTCPAGTWDTNRTGMKGLGFSNPMQSIGGTRVEVLY